MLGVRDRGMVEKGGSKHDHVFDPKWDHLFVVILGVEPRDLGSGVPRNPCFWVVFDPFLGQKGTPFWWCLRPILV